MCIVRLACIRWTLSQARRLLWDWLLQPSWRIRGSWPLARRGLDYHYEPEAAALQQASFALHLQAAKITGKPVIVHTREARADTLTAARLPCRRQGCRIALPRIGIWRGLRWTVGFYISLSGIVTFRNAEALRDVAGYPE